MAEYYTVFSTAQVAKITELSQRQIVSLSEKGIIKPLVEPDGSGTRRIYGGHNVGQLLILKALLDAGFSLRRIKKILTEIAKKRLIEKWGDAPKGKGILSIISFMDGTETLLSSFSEDLASGLVALRKFLQSKEPIQVKGFHTINLAALKSHYDRVADPKVLRLP